MTSLAKKQLTVKDSLIVLFLLSIIVSLAFFSGWKTGYQGRTPGSLFKKSTKDLSDIKRVYSLIEKEFDGDFDPTKSNEYTVEKLVESLGDPYSYYVSKDEYEKLKREERGEFTGIGIIYVIEKKTLVIVEVLPESPAESAGLKTGEKIIQIDDVSVEQLNNEIEVINKLEGEEGKILRLRILGKDNESREVEIERKRFKTPNLLFRLIDNKIGYLKIYQFSLTLQEEFSSITEFQRQGVEKLVIDLRNNIGGDMPMAIFLADQFLKEGIIVREKSKDSQEIIQKASGKAPLGEVKITVLVNSRTASAAEVFAAAIKENNQGKILGERTKGKDTEQTFFELADGSAICLTTGQWFTPKGESVKGKGIEPDIEIPEKIQKDEDYLLKRAIEIIQEREY